MAQDAGSGPDPTEPWRQLAWWTGGSGRRAAELAALSARLVPRCGELVAGLTREMVGTRLPTDPLDLTLRVYGATSGPLSAMARDVLTDEAVLALSRRLLENVATAESLFATLSEDLFRGLRLSTSSDNTRIATLIVGLDEKVDRLEDTVEDLEDGAARTRAAELARLHEQVGRLEAKLDRLLAAGGADGRDPADDGTGDHAGNGAADREGVRR